MDGYGLPPWAWAKEATCSACSTLSHRNPSADPKWTCRAAPTQEFKSTPEDAAIRAAKVAGENSWSARSTMAAFKTRVWDRLASIPNARRI